MTYEQLKQAVAQLNPRYGGVEQVLRLLVQENYIGDPLWDMYTRALVASSTITGDPVVGAMYSEGDGFVFSGTPVVNAGTPQVGTDIGNTTSINQVYYHINEVAATPGFNVEFPFTLGALNPGRFIIVGRYTGSVAHNVVVQAYNNTAMAWQSFTGATSDIPSTSIDMAYTFLFDDLYAENSSVAADYIDSGVVKLRVYHSSAGNMNHDLYIDYMTVEAQQYTVTAAGSYEVLTGLHETVANNVTVDASAGTLTLEKDGWYDIYLGGSFSGTAGATFYMHAFIDDVFQPSIGFGRTLGSVGAVGDAGRLSPTTQLSAGQVIDVRYTSLHTGDFFNLENFSFSARRLN